jgi:hypothetical protein
VTHTEFVAAYRAGRLTVEFDAAPAGKFLSARLLLPLMMLPLLGAGVGLALMGWLWSGLLVIAAGIIAPRLIKRSAPHFLLTQMLSDETLYADAQRAGIMRVETPDAQITITKADTP